MALIKLIIISGFVMVQSDSMTNYASYLYLGAENLSTDIVFPSVCDWGSPLGLKTAFSCKFWAALISASISINFILFNISNTENMLAILLIRELCSPAIYFYLTLLSLFALKINIYHTCVIIRIWAIAVPSLTHHDIKVDIEKMLLAGPRYPKFHYQHHYLVWIPTQNNW